METIQKGVKIPQFIAKDQHGKAFDSNNLIGSPFVLYFYPKDDTPGCTVEACSFRDNLEEFDQLDAIVVGISPDSSESHQKFMQKHALNFTLLFDENFGIAKKFQVVNEKDTEGKKSFQMIRSTFVVDSLGVIQWIEKPVSVEGHVERVIQALRNCEQ